MTVVLVLLLLLLTLAHSRHGCFKLGCAGRLVPRLLSDGCLDVRLQSVYLNAQLFCAVARGWWGTRAGVESEHV